MKPRASFIIVILALALTPFASSIRTLSQKIEEELNITPGFPLASGAQAMGAVFLPPVAEAAAMPPALLETPGRLVIPAIKLNVAVGSVGLTSTGNMGVLNNPKKVSWYQNGPVPGAFGSAVIAAHVFQSFAKLKDMKVGDSIYVRHSDGSVLRFVVSEIDVYPYNATEPLAKIFNRSDEPRLNLITCDGALTPNHATYDHRLVVFAELAKQPVTYSLLSIR